jgi:hypothetical protein
MALNVENQGNPICLLDKKIVSICDNKNDVMHPLFDIKAKYNQKFQQIPNVNKKRDILFIAGQSGSGKSYYISQYLIYYKKFYPKNDIYLFSYLKEDETLDKTKGIKRIDIDNPDFLDMEIETDDFENSMVIFDDCECISNKKTLKKVNEISNKLLITGRHNNVSICFVSHQVTNGQFTKTILNESSSITIFPSTLGNRNLKYLLSEYLGFDKKEIEKIKKSDSRWTTIIKSFPKVILTENECYIPSKI